MTDLTLKFNFTDRGGAAVYDVVQADEYPGGLPFAETHLGQVRIPPVDNSELLQEIRDLDSELKAKNKRNKHLAKRIKELEAAIERVKACERIPLMRCLDMHPLSVSVIVAADVDKALEGEAE